MLIYPAIFHRTIEGGYIVVFPDFNDGATEGQTLEQAMEMAEAVGQLNLYTAPVVILFYNGKEIHRQARFIDFSELDYRIKQTL